MSVLKTIASLPSEIKQYLIITGNYWSFTLTDGALRMLVVLHFHALGYSPLEIAMLFLFYEVFGVVTNLFGGWLGARLGLNKTMNLGLLLQIAALGMLLVPSEWLTVVWVMTAQALSGIAKDLNKMSAKSAIKLLVSPDKDSTLYYWVALLTGSKNALKGVGFFLGGALLTAFGFTSAILIMLLGLVLVWVFSLLTLKQDLGRSRYKPKFSQIFSKSRNINLLSAARMFLFGARDVWFVVALPVYLAATFNWDHWYVGSFLAIWVIGYGFVQALAPKLTSRLTSRLDIWAALLSLIPFFIAMAISYSSYQQSVLIIGLLAFGAVFAVNSSLHSYTIVSMARHDGVSMDVGFYYMANAMGRLIGTLLSGWIFQMYGLVACLILSGLFLLAATSISVPLTKRNKN